MASQGNIRSTDIEVALRDSVDIAEAHDGHHVNRAVPFEIEITDEVRRPEQSWLQRNRRRIFGIVSQVSAIISLLLTAAMAWPAVSSAGDARMGTLLAEWTSQKEWIEFCETHEEHDLCAGAKHAQLPPPPTKSRVFRRIVESRLGLSPGYAAIRIPPPYEPGLEHADGHLLEALGGQFAQQQDIIFSLVLSAVFFCVTLLCLLEAVRRTTKAIRTLARKTPEVAKEGLLPWEPLRVLVPPTPFERLLQFLERWTRPPASPSRPARTATDVSVPHVDACPRYIDIQASPVQLVEHIALDWVPASPLQWFAPHSRGPPPDDEVSGQEAPRVSSMQDQPLAPDDSKEESRNGVRITSEDVCRIRTTTNDSAFAQRAAAAAARNTAHKAAAASGGDARQRVPFSRR